MSRPRKGRLFTGLRLLVKGAPSRKKDRFYEIVARVDEQSYAVRHSIYSFPMQDSPENRERAQVILGVLWSSLTLYYLFLSEGRFGIWFEQINLEEFQYLPLPLFETSERGANLHRRIASIVRQLGQTPGERNLFSEGEGDLVAQLDEAVFDFYELSSRERNLVRDMCEVGFDLLANGPKSDALKPLSRPKDKPRAGFAEDLEGAHCAWRSGRLLARLP